VRARAGGFSAQELNWNTSAPGRGSGGRGGPGSVSSRLVCSDNSIKPTCPI
jgi:hypothetical protein